MQLLLSARPYVELIHHIRARTIDGVREALTEQADQVALAMPTVARDELSPQERR
jgi:hypothetical protein